jgi:2-desacetyl-2-hydroxyethyl bacteriochlorophyllide A dehydrogenase
LEVNAMKSRAVLFVAENKVEFGETEIPEPGAGEVLIETEYSCISPGTELRCLAGLQENATSWPYIPGYALSGRVIGRGPGADLPDGTPVYCSGTTASSHERAWGGQVAHAVAQQDHIYKIPENVSLKEASLGHLAAIALRGVRLARPQLGENVVVVGLGPVGHLSARIYAALGIQVLGADTLSSRAQILRSAGIDAVSAQPGDLVQEVKKHYPEGADIVVDATGLAAASDIAVQLGRDIPWEDETLTASRYIVQGSYPVNFSIFYDTAFRKELTLLFARDVRPSDYSIIFSLLGSGRLKLDGILGTPRDPKDAPAVYEELRTRRCTELTAAFNWKAES